MDRQQLLCYLKGALDLETAVHACDEMIAKTTHTYNGIIDPTVISEPKYHALTEYSRTCEKPEKKEWTYYFNPLTAGILGFVIMIVITMIFEEFLYSILPTQNSYIIYGLIIGIASGVAMAYILAKIEAQKDYAEKMAYYKENLEYHRKEKEKHDKGQEYYRAKNDSMKSDYNQAISIRENIVWQNYYNRVELYNILTAEQQRRQDLQNKLNKYYSLNIIHPTYRNLIAIAQIYDYIDAGITDTLTGPQGAYAQYQHAYLAGLICTSLSEIRNRLDSVIQNQYQMTEILRSIDANTAALSSQMEDMLEVSSRNTAQLNNIMEYSRTWGSSVAEHLAQMNQSMNSVAQSSRSIAESNDMIAYNVYMDSLSRGVAAYYNSYSKY